MAVSQGNAAMSLRCAGICNDWFVENFVVSLEVKECQNRLTFREVIDTSRVSLFFYMFAPEFANIRNMAVSQCSAATSLRYGGRCNDTFVENFC